MAGQELWRGQFVAVSFSGLAREATNLKDRLGLGSAQDLFDCSPGWWVGRVYGYWLANGDYVEARRYEDTLEGERSEEEGDDGELPDPSCSESSEEEGVVKVQARGKRTTKRRRPAA